MSDVEMKFIGSGEPDEKVCDIVFIHGLDGDMTKTWCHDKANPADSWPRWTADALLGAAVWLVGYDAASLKWLGNSMPIVERATNLLRLFEIHGIGRRPVALIGHSMGGLLIKQMLRHAEELGEKRWSGFKDNTKLIVFVATPHHGADIPHYLDALRKLLRPNEATLELRSDTPSLSNLNQYFRYLIERSGIEIASFYETLPTASVRVVDDRSADFGFPGKIPTPVMADHIAICKPATKTELVADYTLQLLKEFVASAAPLPDDVKRRPGADLLKYQSTTDVENNCLDTLLSGTAPCDIQYSEDIESVVGLVRRYDDDIGLYLRKIPYMRKIEHDRRKTQESAAIYHSEIHAIRMATAKMMEENRKDLAHLLARLKADAVPAELARGSLKIFAAFAALRVIRKLKQFYDIDNDKPALFFESFVFNKDPCYCWLDWVPEKSHTGKRIFGYYHYVGARVGSSAQYAYVMLPLDVARPIFKDSRRGDPELFYRWILPQLYIIGGWHGNIDEFPFQDYNIVTLHGSNHEEWKFPFGDNDPWKGSFG